MSHACQRFWKCYKTLTFCSFCQGAQSLAPATRSDIWTSKSAPYPSVFCTFDLEICFAPQRRALFRHLNFQKWSENGVLCTFWLRHVLRATTACTFSTSQLPKVVRGWSALYIFTSKCVRATTACTFSTSQLPKVVRDPGVLYILTCKCASRHNGVQFFISHLASWLRTRRFSEPTFRPSGAQNHWKNTVFRDFPTFLRICIFFLRTLSLLLFFLLIFLFSLPLPCSAFHLSILSEVWLLNFIVGSLTSKLPSTIVTTCYNYFCCLLLEIIMIVLRIIHDQSIFSNGGSAQVVCQDVPSNGSTLPSGRRCRASCIAVRSARAAVSRGMRTASNTGGLSPKVTWKHLGRRVSD